MKKKKELRPNMKKQKTKNVDWRIKIKNKTKIYKRTKEKIINPKNEY
jgi:hypothetical protein